MRKSLALIASILTIIVMVNPLIYAQIETEPVSFPMIWEFSNTSNVVNDTPVYTDLSYDETLQALKVGTKLDDNGISLNPARIGLNAGTPKFPANISMTGYPVVAIRVKLNKADSKGWFMHFKTTANTAMNGNGIMDYADTTEWQTLILDMRSGLSSAAVGGDWTRITFTFFQGNGGAGQNNTQTSAEDIIWVDWVGLFASESAAQVYINGGTTPLIMDFESAATVPPYSKSTDTQVAYDESAKALKVSAVDDGDKTWINPARIEFHTLPVNDVAVSEYPYLAIRFKLSRRDIKNWYFHFRTDKSEEARIANPGLSANYALASPTYTETDDWQTIVVNANDAIDKGLMNKNLGVTDSSGWGNWTRFIFTFINPPTAQAGDAVWIDWVGVFETEKDALAYGNENRTQIMEFENEQDIPGYLLSEDTQMTFDQEESALKLTAADNGNGKWVNPNRIEFFDLPMSDLKVSDYPYLAIRFRLSRADMQSWYFHFRTDRSELVRESNPNLLVNYCLANPKYTQTDDWQYLIIDANNAFEADKLNQNLGVTDISGWGKWERLIFTFINPSTVKAGDAVWIDWVGVFETENDAVEYGGGDQNKTTVMEFENEQDIPGYLLSEDTQMTYDQEKSALKLTAADNGNGKWVNPNRIEFYNLPISDLKVSDYPYLAIRFRLSRADMQSWYFHFRTDQSELARESNPSLLINYCLANPQYIQTDEWQYLIINANDAFEADKLNQNLGVTDISGWGKWERLIFTFINPSTVQAGDAVWIDWVGVFETENAAVEYAGGENPPVEPDPDPDPVKSNLIGFDTEDTVPAYALSADTRVSYDKKNGAIKVSAVDNGDKKWENPARVEFHDLPMSDYKISDYPYLAIRYKLSRADIPGWYFHYRTGKSEEARVAGKSDRANFGLAKPAYEITEDWQISLVDAREAIDKKALNDILGTENASGWGNWASLIFTFIDASGARENDTVQIDWIGVFQTEKDVWTYAGGKPGYAEPDAPSPFFVRFDDIGAASIAKADSEDTQVSFDEKKKALKVAAADKNKDGEYVNPGRVAFNVDNKRFPPNISINDYSVVAMRIRLNKETSKPWFCHFRTDNSINAGKGNLGYGLIPYGSYNDESQVVLMNMKNAHAAGDVNGNWASLILTFFEGYAPSAKDYSAKNENIGTDDVVWIEWIGFFESTDSAKSFAGLGVKSRKAPVPLFFDMSFRENINELIIADSADTEIKYDKANKATRVAAIDKNNDGVYLNPARIALGTTAATAFKKKLNLSRYPVVALRVKLSRSDLKPWFCHFRSDVTNQMFNQNRSSTINYAIGMMGYKETTDWQTVYLDVRNTNYQDINSLGYWESLIFTFIDGTNAKKGDYVLVDWIALFQSVEQLQSYTGETLVAVPGSGNEATGPIIYDLTTNANIKKYTRWSNEDDTRVEFDSAANAMKVSAADAEKGQYADNVLSNNTARFEIPIPVDTFARSNEYPILAVRIKLNNTLSTAGWYSFKTDAFNKFYGACRPEYKETDQYQTVFIDINSSQNTMQSFFKGYWAGLSFDLALGNMASENDVFWVEWVGLFDTLHSAMTYAGETIADIEPDEEVKEQPPPKTDVPVDEKKPHSNIPLITGIAAAVFVVISVPTVIYIIRRKKSKQTDIAGGLSGEK